MRQSIGRFVVGLVLVTGVGAGTGLAAALVAPGVAGADTGFSVNDAGDAGLLTAGGKTCVSTDTAVVDEETVNTCTLRAAIEASNNLRLPTTIDLPDPTNNDVMLITGSDYVVDNNSADTGFGELEIDDVANVDDVLTGQSVTIAGDSASVVTIEGTATSNQTRILKVDPNAIASISGVTISNGDASTSGEHGGAILNCATLTLSASVISDNHTNAGEGGGIYTESTANTTLTDDTIIGNSGSEGGGIYGDGGTMSLTGGVIVSHNTASDDGGGIYTAGTNLTITGGTIGGTGSVESETGGNTAEDGSGGGLAFFGGTVTLSGVTIGGSDPTQGNKADNGDGGGVFASIEDPSFTGDTIEHNTADNGDGGGVYLANGTSTFTNETIEDNLATYDASSGGDGGGVYIESGTNTFSGGSISSNTSNEGDGGNGGGGGVYLEAGTNSFTSTSILSNVAQNGSSGGGAYVEDGTNSFTNTNVTLNQAQGDGQGGGFYYEDGTNTFTGGSIDSNTAYDGGGAFLEDGTETFTQTDISSNTATEAGAGLFIFVESVATPTTITSSTISQNTFPPEVSGETPFVGDGGGILAEGCNQINLTNDTIAGNTANDLGGGYYGVDCQSEETGISHPAAKPAATSHAIPPGVTNFLFDTIDANTSGSGGGNINTSDLSTLNVAETIVADGVSEGIEGTNCTFSDGGTLTSGGYNLIDDTTCGTAASTDIIGQSPQLGALGNNGGPTNTELPASTSPAVGAVPASVCSGTGVTTDQRGNARGAGLHGSCTIGAVEVSVAAPPAFNPNGYRLVANEGGIFDFGLNFDGSLANNHLNAPIIGIANSPGYDGYVMAGSDGGVFALGGANFYGSLGSQAIPSPISAIAAPPSENGYWLVAQNGKIYNYGSAPALPAVQLPAGAHIVGMASTTDGGGGWLTDQFGDVYAEGDALYEGGLGGVHINKPIVGIAAAAAGQGYVLAASDGGVFNYGTQGFFGSVPGSLQPGQHLVAPIVGIAVTHSGHGYWLAGADGGVFNYGDAPFLGSIYTAIPGKKLNGPVVGIQHLGST